MEPISAVWLLLTNRCNLHCKYCWAGREVHPPMDMTVRTAARAMAFLSEVCEEDAAITFFGGEPLLNWPVLKYIFDSYPHQNYCIFTNAMLLNRDIIEYFHQRRDFINIVLSMDGNTQTQVENRGAMPDITLVKEVLSRFQDTKISFTVAKPATLVDDVRSLYAIGARKIAVKRVHFKAVDGGFDDEYQKQLKMIAQDYLLRKAVVVEDSKIPCGVGEQYLSVGPAGDIYPCDVFYWNSHAYLGNVFNGFLPNAEKTLEELRFTKQRKNASCLADTLFGPEATQGCTC